jgi:hypothetical protein
MSNFFSQSEAFADFHAMMDRWDMYCAFQEQEDRLNDILDKHELILFFTKGKDLYGAPEDSRVIFAKLKADDDDDPMMPNFRQEAQFRAVNLFKAMSGEEGLERVFNLKDIPELKVVDREKAIDMMLKNKKTK